MIQNNYTPLPLFFRHHVPVQNWDTIKSKLDDLVAYAYDHDHDLEIGRAKSTYNTKRDGHFVNPLDWECLQYLLPEISNVTHHAVKEWKLNCTAYRVTQCWTNVHKLGGRTAFHKHGVATSFVIAYYLNVPEDSGDLLMIDPLEYHWNSYNSPEVARNNDFGWEHKVKAGDMIIMPNFLIHGAGENKNPNEDRYVLTINVEGIWGGET